MQQCSIFWVLLNVKLLNVIYINKMSKFYEQLCYTFIRPSRQVYSIRDLGPQIKGDIRRHDITLISTRQQKLVVSYFKNKSYKDQQTACVIYLHSMNGSRLQSQLYVPLVLNSMKNISFCSFDFGGSGNSEGEHVSLGYFEHMDLCDIVCYLRRQFGIRKYIFWGRSMGASTILKNMCQYSRLKQQQQIQIHGAILDSPFYSLKTLAIQIAQSRINLPQFLIRALLIPISAKIQQLANFRIDQLQLLQYAQAIDFPVLLLASKTDQLIDYSHSEKIYKQIKYWDKEIYYLEGEHNDERTFDVLSKVLMFIKSCLNTEVPRHSLLSSCTRQNTEKVLQLEVQVQVPQNCSSFLQQIQIQTRHQRKFSTSVTTKNKMIQEKDKAFNMGHYSIEKIKKTQKPKKLHQNRLNQESIEENKKQITTINLMGSPKKSNLRSQSSLNHTPKIKLTSVKQRTKIMHISEIKAEGMAMSLNQNYQEKLRRLKANQSLQIRKKQIDDIAPFCIEKIEQQDQQELKQMPDQNDLKQKIQNYSDDNHFNIINQKLKLCKQQSKRKNNAALKKSDNKLKSSKSIESMTLITPRKNGVVGQKNSEKVLRQKKNGKWLQTLEEQSSIKNRNQLMRSKPIFQSFCGLTSIRDDRTIQFDNF